MVASKKNAPSAVKTKCSSVAGKDKVCNNQDYGEDLVGSKIRVWWPLDCKFYKGVVDAFYSSTKKHRVSYEDGDEETLDMKKERWEVVEEDDDASADEISIDEKSGEESSEATQEPNNGKMGDVRWKVVASASRMRSLKSIYEETDQRQTKTSSKKNMRNKEEEGGSEKPFDDDSKKYKEDEDGNDDEESYDDDSKKNKIDGNEGGDDEESSDDDSKKNKMEDEDGVNKMGDGDGGDDIDDSMLLRTFLKKTAEEMKVIMDKLKEKRGDDDEEAPKKMQKREF